MYTIIDIYWERANLHLKFKEDISNKYIYLTDEEKNIYNLDSLNNEVIISIYNISNIGMLDSGNWTLLITDKKIDNYEIYLTYKDYLYKNILLDNKLLTNLNDKSRIFRYHGNSCAYIVDFSIDSNKVFKINTTFMIRNYNWHRFVSPREKNSIIEKIKVYLKEIAFFLINLYYKFIRLFIKSKDNNILFLTENSDELTVNLNKLYEYADSNKWHKYIYAHNSFLKERKNVLSKIRNYFKEVTMISKCNTIVVDNYTSVLTHLELDKKVKLAQIWHAGVGFKSVGYARFGIPGTPHPYLSCHRRYTHAFVDREDLIPIYMEVFGIDRSKFYVTGMPRLDGYLDKKNIDNTLDKLSKINNKFLNKKVILFSPTYRGKGSLDAYYNYSLLDQTKIYEFCKKNNFIFVIKMHPFIEESIEIEKDYQDYIYDYSNLDINELIYVSDIMITDYSSCAYEYSMFDRPLIFHRFDKEEYEYERPVHTLDIFSDRQYEVKDFNSLMKVLEKEKDININNRFKNIKGIPNNNACKNIMDILEGKDD